MVRSWKLFWGSIAKTISLYYVTVSGANILAEKFVADQIDPSYDIAANQAKLKQLGFYVE